jgi:hypothetical protein
MLIPSLMGLILSGGQDEIVWEGIWECYEKLGMRVGGLELVEYYSKSQGWD